MASTVPTESLPLPSVCPLSLILQPYVGMEPPLRFPLRIHRGRMAASSFFMPLIHVIIALQKDKPYSELWKWHMSALFFYVHFNHPRQNKRKKEKKEKRKKLLPLLCHICYPQQDVWSGGLHIITMMTNILSDVWKRYFTVILRNQFLIGQAGVIRT